MCRNQKELTFRLGVFASGPVGYETVRFLCEAHPEDLCAVVLTEDLDIGAKVRTLGVPDSMILCSDTLYEAETVASLRSLRLDYVLLAWWPYIIRSPLFSIPAKGTLNFHPSYLPHNRGKHYNFWTLVEDTPFGVTIHFVDEGIDTGDIVFQKRIEKTWEDTGGSLYYKAQDAMISLFRDNYGALRSGAISRRPQRPEGGSFHYGRELEAASQIVADAEYTGRRLLNLIRARTFPPHPSCRLHLEEEAFNVTISIARGAGPASDGTIDLEARYRAGDILSPRGGRAASRREYNLADGDMEYHATIEISPGGE
jgi:methionyl-tRNA formyltransferase